MRTGGKVRLRIVPERVRENQRGHSSGGNVCASGQWFQCVSL